MVTDDNRRWAPDNPEIPQRTGKINNAQKFDASFFGVHYKQAHTMDPMCRLLMERAYEAVVDAGNIKNHFIFMYFSDINQLKVDRCCNYRKKYA